MAAPELVEEAVATGRQIIESLGKDPFLTPTAFMWLYDSSAEEWRFVIATPALTTKGRRAVYKRILGVLKRSELLDKLPLDRITAILPSHKIISGIKQFRRSRFPWQNIADTKLVNCDLGEGLHSTNVYCYKFP
jgi:hypothetical protein